MKESRVHQLLAATTERLEPRRPPPSNADAMKVSRRQAAVDKARRLIDPLAPDVRAALMALLKLMEE